MWFVEGTLMFQKWFNVVDVLDFQIELCCRYFGILFGSASVFWLLFSKVGQFFSQSSGHPESLSR